MNEQNGFVDTMSKAAPGAVEIVQLKFRAGVSADDQLQAMRDLDGIASKMAGFVSRDYFYDQGNKQWVDLVLWQDAGAAKAAGDAIMQAEGVAQIFAQLDESATSLAHYSRMGGARAG